MDNEKRERDIRRRLTELKKWIHNSRVQSRILSEKQREWAKEVNELAQILENKQE